MADRIVVSTERLEYCLISLREISDTLEDVRSSLRSVGLDEDSGGKLSTSFKLQLKSCDRQISGKRAEDVLEALANGIRYIENRVDDTQSGVRTAINIFDDVENGIINNISSLGTGKGTSNEEAKQAVSNLSRYEVEYQNGQEVLDRNRTAWEAQDQFIDTQYNQDLMKKLQETILNDPLFSQEEWEKCITREQKEAFVQRMYDRIESIYQTDLREDIYFIYREDFVERKKILCFEYTKEKENVSIQLANGGVTSASKFEIGHYNTVHDVIVVNLDNCNELKDIVGLLCHENRHNLQLEIMNADNLDKYDGVNGEDYDKIIQARDHWQNDKDNYRSITQAALDKREKEIKDEMDFGQWWNDRKNAENYAYTELYEEYAGQQLEVDARYAEESAERWMQERNAAQI